MPPYTPPPCLSCASIPNFVSRRYSVAATEALLAANPALEVAARAALAAAFPGHPAATATAATLRTVIFSLCARAMLLPTFRSERRTDPALARFRSATPPTASAAAATVNAAKPKPASKLMASLNLSDHARASVMSELSLAPAPAAPAAGAAADAGAAANAGPSPMTLSLPDTCLDTLPGALYNILSAVAMYRQTPLEKTFESPADSAAFAHALARAFPTAPLPSPRALPASLAIAGSGSTALVHVPTPDVQALGARTLPEEARPRYFCSSIAMGFAALLREQYTALALAAVRAGCNHRVFALPADVLRTPGALRAHLAAQPAGAAAALMGATDIFTGLVAGGAVSGRQGGNVHMLIAALKSLLGRCAAYNALRSQLPAEGRLNFASAALDHLFVARDSNSSKSSVPAHMLQVPEWDEPDSTPRAQMLARLFRLTPAHALYSTRGARSWEDVYSRPVEPLAGARALPDGSEARRLPLLLYASAQEDAAELHPLLLRRVRVVPVAAAPAHARGPLARDSVSVTGATLAVTIAAAPLARLYSAAEEVTSGAAADADIDCRRRAAAVLGAFTSYVAPAVATARLDTAAAAGPDADAAADAEATSALLRELLPRAAPLVPAHVDDPLIRAVWHSTFSTDNLPNSLVFPRLPAAMFDFALDGLALTRLERCAEPRARVPAGTSVSDPATGLTLPLADGVTVYSSYNNGIYWQYNVLWHGVEPRYGATSAAVTRGARPLPRTAILPWLPVSETSGALGAPHDSLKMLAAAAASAGPPLAHCSLASSAPPRACGYFTHDAVCLTSPSQAARRVHRLPPALAAALAALAAEEGVIAVAEAARLCRADQGIGSGAVYAAASAAAADTDAAVPTLEWADARALARLLDLQSKYSLPFAGRAASAADLGPALVARHRGFVRALRRCGLSFLLLVSEGTAAAAAHAAPTPALLSTGAAAAALHAAAAYPWLPAWAAAGAVSCPPLSGSGPAVYGYLAHASLAREPFWLSELAFMRRVYRGALEFGLLAVSELHTGTPLFPAGSYAERADDPAAEAAVTCGVAARARMAALFDVRLLLTVLYVRAAQVTQGTFRPRWTVPGAAEAAGALPANHPERAAAAASVGATPCCAACSPPYAFCPASLVTRTGGAEATVTDGLAPWVLEALFAAACPLAPAADAPADAPLVPPSASAVTAAVARMLRGPFESAAWMPQLGRVVAPERTPTLADAHSSVWTDPLVCVSAFLRLTARAHRSVHSMLVLPPLATERPQLPELAAFDAARSADALVASAAAAQTPAEDGTEACEDAWTAALGMRLQGTAQTGSSDLELSRAATALFGAEQPDCDGLAYANSMCAAPTAQPAAARPVASEVAAMHVRVSAALGSEPAGAGAGARVTLADLFADVWHTFGELRMLWQQGLVHGCGDEPVAVPRPPSAGPSPVAASGAVARPRETPLLSSVPIVSSACSVKAVAAHERAQLRARGDGPSLAPVEWAFIDDSDCDCGAPVVTWANAAHLCQYLETVSASGAAVATATRNLGPAAARIMASLV
jgi:hypothetical protein